MSLARISRFRSVLTALAVMAALLNAWLLTLHTRSVILSEALRIAGAAAPFCHSGAGKTIDGSDSRNELPAPSKTCPVCSGLASLHLGDIAAPLAIVLATTRGASISAPGAELAVDHRPLRPLNRGPPLLS